MYNIKKFTVMFQWLKRIFMNNTEPSNSPINGNKVENNTAAQSQVVEREFEIAVYDVSIDENTGKECITPVAFARPLTITATSKAEL